MAGTSWITFIPNTKARAEDVNNNFNWLEGDIVPMTDGNTTNGAYNLGDVAKAWNNLYMTGTLYLGGTDTYIKETSANVISIYAGDTQSSTFITSGMALPSGQRIFFDGGGDTYAHESSANTLDVIVGGALSIKFLSSNTVALPSLGRLYFDSGNSSYITSPSTNTVSIVANSVTVQTWNQTYSQFPQDIYLSTTKKLYLDGGGDTYIFESSANIMRFYSGNVLTLQLDLSTGVQSFQSMVVQSGQKLYLDGGGDTYIFESSTNTTRHYAGGVLRMQLDSSGIHSFQSLIVQSGQNLYMDGGSNTYIQENGADIMSFYTGGNEGFRVDNNDAFAPNGIRIGTYTSNKHIDDSAQGAGTTSLYIGNAVINVISDIRLKKNIEDTKMDSLKLLEDIRVVDFDWNNKVAENDDRKQRGRYTGMLAQEMIKVAPWTINHQGGKDCELCKSGKECKEHTDWQVQYEYLVPVLVKAIQELTTRVKQLEKANA